MQAAPTPKTVEAAPAPKDGEAVPVPTPTRAMLKYWEQFKVSKFSTRDPHASPSQSNGVVPVVPKASSPVTPAVNPFMSSSEAAPTPSTPAATPQTSTAAVTAALTRATTVDLSLTAPPGSHTALPGVEASKASALPGVLAGAAPAPQHAPVGTTLPPQPAGQALEAEDEATKAKKAGVLLSEPNIYVARRQSAGVELRRDDSTGVSKAFSMNFSLPPATRGKDCPKAVQDKFLQVQGSGGLRHRAGLSRRFTGKDQTQWEALFDIWVDAGENWGKSSLVLQSTSSREHSKTGSWKTMSRTEPCLPWVCVCSFLVLGPPRKVQRQCRDGRRLDSPQDTREDVSGKPGLPKQ